MAIKPSKETQTQATKIAKGIQKPGQTKEQTKLIAQGIEKGISEYKKLQAKKSRLRDKERKHQNKQKLQKQQENQLKLEGEISKQTNKNVLPWLLLALSWLMFIGLWFYK